VPEDTPGIIVRGATAPGSPTCPATRVRLGDKPILLYNMKICEPGGFSYFILALGRLGWKNCLLNELIL
jgi:hypothetical protein